MDKARVLTLAEALQAEVCWVEPDDARHMSDIQPCYVAESRGGLIIICCFKAQYDYHVKSSDYGKEFRCWSARPTTEQLVTEAW